jgi:hypothetical protein
MEIKYKDHHEGLVDIDVWLVVLLFVAPSFFVTDYED